MKTDLIHPNEKEGTCCYFRNEFLDFDPFNLLNMKCLYPCNQVGEGVVENIFLSHVIQCLFIYSNKTMVDSSFLQFQKRIRRYIQGYITQYYLSL